MLSFIVPFFTLPRHYISFLILPTKLEVARSIVSTLGSSSRLNTIVGLPNRAKLGSQVDAHVCSYYLLCSLKLTVFRRESFRAYLNMPKENRIGRMSALWRTISQCGLEDLKHRR